jgi:predicted O-methyltransferase YrrM
LISTSLTRAETDQLRWLAAGGDVLEIGSAYGYSAVVMASASARVVAVDPHTWLNSYDAMVANLDAYDLRDRVDIRRSDSWTVLPELHAQGKRFDLVWIDGDHEAPTVAHDVEWARKLLRDTGTLACHDYGEDTCPGVRQALDAWKPPPELVDTLAIYRAGQW